MLTRNWLLPLALLGPMPLAHAANDYGYTMLGSEHPCAPAIAKDFAAAAKASGVDPKTYPFELRAEGHCSHARSDEPAATKAGTLDACKKALDSAVVKTMKQLAAECSALCAGLKAKWTLDAATDAAGKEGRWLVDGMGQTENHNLTRKSTGTCR